MKKIFEELKKGEPFYFIRSGNILKIGFSCDYDKKNEEHCVWECAVIKSDCKLVKKKKVEVNKK